MTDFGMDPNQINNLNDLRPLAILGRFRNNGPHFPCGCIQIVKRQLGNFLISKGRRAERTSIPMVLVVVMIRIMTRGTFANVRIKNRMADGKEGGYTQLMPEGELMAIS